VTSQDDEFVSFARVWIWGEGAEGEPTAGGVHSRRSARTVIRTALSALLCGVCAALTAACCLSGAHQVSLRTWSVDSSPFSSPVLPLSFKVRQESGAFHETLVLCQRRSPMKARTCSAAIRVTGASLKFVPRFDSRTI